MPVSDDVAIVPRQACEYATDAETSEKLDELQDYGGRARNTLESIERSDMDSSIRHKIEEAIRHATNGAARCKSERWRHDAGKAES